MRALHRILFVLCAVLWFGRAQAATVAILRPSSNAPAVGEALFRLKGELLAVGLAVSVADRPRGIESSSEAFREWFERVATEQELDAVIDVVGDGTPLEVDIWLWERSPRRLRATRVAVDSNTENAAATLAIRSIEVLRSSLIAFDLSGTRQPGADQAPTPAKPAPALPSQPTNPASERASRFGLSAGATAITSLDGIGLAILPLVRLDWALHPRVALQATVAGFGTRPRITTEEGSVEVAQQFALLGVCACKTSDSRIRAIAALSLGAMHTALEGRASMPNVGHDVARWAFLAEASAGAELRLFGSSYLTLASHLQLATPYVAVHSLDSVVATAGRPNLRFTLTAGAWL